VIRSITAAHLGVPVHGDGDSRVVDGHVAARLVPQGGGQVEVVLGEIQAVDLGG